MSAYDKIKERMLNDPEYREKVLLQRRKSRKKYYETHKEKVKEINKKWRENNREKFNELVYNNRKKRAERLKAQGEKYCWLTDKERTKKLKK